MNSYARFREGWSFSWFRLRFLMGIIRASEAQPRRFPVWKNEETQISNVLAVLALAIIGVGGFHAFTLLFFMA